jgi:hypothetical protein
MFKHYQHTWKEIPGLPRTCTNFQGLSRPRFIFLKFKDFPGFSGPVATLTNIVHDQKAN